MYREDEMHEFKKTTGELNEALISISSIWTRCDIFWLEKR